MSAKGRKRRKKQAPGVVLLSVLLLVASGYGVIQGEVLLADVLSGGTTSGSDLRIPYNQDASLEASGSVHVLPGGIVRCDQGELTLFTDQGDPLWKKQLNGREVLIDGTARAFAVVEPAGGDVYVLDYEGTVQARTFGMGRIDRMAFNKDGMIVVYLAGNHEVVLLDDGLMELKRIPLPEGNVLDMAVSKSKSLLAISMFRMDNEKYHSQILTWTLDGQLIGVINREASIILDMKVVDNEVIAIYDNGVAKYNSDNSELWWTEVDRKIYRGTIGSEGTTVLNVLKSDVDPSDQRPENALLYIDANGNVLREQAMVKTINDVSYRGGLTGIYTDQRVSIIDEKGKMIRNEELSATVSSMVWLEKGQLGILLPDELVIVPFQ